jgi:hypothetical protein
MHYRKIEGNKMKDINFEEVIGSDTVEGLLVRVQRQRDRAGRWSQKCEEANAEIVNLKTELAKAIASVSEQRIEFESNIVVIEKQFTEEIAALKTQLREQHFNRWDQGREYGKVHALEKYALELRAGKAALKAQEKVRKLRVLEKLYNGPLFQEDDQPVQWLRGVLKKGLPTTTPIEVIPGKTPPIIKGHSGYHTTPSGKTVVQYPGAYKWRTVYHCSNIRVVVGYDWIVKNKRKLACKYIDTHKI